MGSTSTGTFTISLKIDPCVNEVARTDDDDPDDLCFSAPGIESLVIHCPGDPDSMLAIYPENNRFCLNKEDKDRLMKNMGKLETVSELLLIAPN
ncbi:hypothetical protein GCM10023116_50410 [Kistimonas scapharcae]|uniref:Uncharacterized protein n=1 Tax=Kistimonas scapharcae TaxID=1036133 RepID=A0ABP8VCM6_9GAMM